MTSLDLNTLISDPERVAGDMLALRDNSPEIPEIPGIPSEISPRRGKGPVPDLKALAARASEQALEYLLSIQHEDGHWCAELESNVTITAEYVLMCQMLGMAETLAGRGPLLIRYLLGEQNADGSWSIASSWDGDVSTTAEAYLALRILGVSRDHPELARAERYILRHGGLEKIRIFTRIFFAMFGLFPWSAIPVISPEFILLPPSSPVNIYALSSWARGTMIPLFIIFHHQPVYALPNGRSETNDFLDHLWLNPADKRVPYATPWLRLLLDHGPSWKTLFGTADLFLKLYDRVRIGTLRSIALDRCVKWVLEHQEKSGDWAGIFPPMLNGVIALTLRGHGLDSEPVRKGIDAIHRFGWEDAAGLRIQACVSPVWDTALSLVSLADALPPSQPLAGNGAAGRRAQDAMRWILDRQLRVEYGDWKVYRPRLAPGGWSFEYENSWYPDIDDTAAVLLALLKQDPGQLLTEPVERAIGWILGMQNDDGGWAAFDANNERLYLNEIPFSDMDSLCDPSCADVTGRVLESFGVALEILSASSRDPLPELRKGMELACGRGVAYLRRTQELAGSWYGRWGVNYIYGTSNALCGLSRLGLSGADPMIARSLDWLRHVQNLDGGWGESLASYSDKRWMGRGVSTASQSAWALMALLAFLPADHPSIERGILWLVRHQRQARDLREPRRTFAAPGPDGGGMGKPATRGASWDESQYTGTGFPNHFYLRYHLYRHCFPMMALGRYLQARRAC